MCCDTLVLSFCSIPCLKHSTSRNQPDGLLVAVVLIFTHTIVVLSIPTTFLLAVTNRPQRSNRVVWFPKFVCVWSQKSMPSGAMGDSTSFILLFYCKSTYATQLYARRAVPGPLFQSKEGGGASFLLLGVGDESFWYPI